VSSRSWTGGAYWNYRRRHPLFGDRAWLTGYANYPEVQLRLDDKAPRPEERAASQPEIVFAWPEVEKMDRVRVFIFPYLDEGVRITLGEVMFWGIPRRLLFFSGRRERTMDITRVRRVQRRKGATQGREHVRGALIGWHTHLERSLAEC
jgi:hypothetical protein